MSFFKQCCFVFCAAILNIMYGVVVFASCMLTALLNLALYAKFRHEATNSQLILPVEYGDIRFSKQDSLFGIAVQKILLNTLCPLAYKIISLNDETTLVLQLCAIKNVWLGTNFSNVRITAGAVELNYYIVKKQKGFGALQFLWQQKRKRKSSVDMLLDNFEIPIIEETKTTLEHKTTTNAKEKVRNWLLKVLQSINVSIETLSLRQIVLQNDFNNESLLNLQLSYAEYIFKDQRYTLQFRNFNIELARAENTEKIVNIHLTEPLVFRLDAAVAQCKVNFDDPRGKLCAKMRSNAVAEISKWNQKYFAQQQQQQQPNQQKTKQKPVSKNRFRLDVCLSVEACLETNTRNKLGFCLRNIHCCYDNIIDNNRLFFRIQSMQIDVRKKKREKQNPDLTVHSGVIECSLYLYEQKSAELVFCEETYLCCNATKSAQKLVTLAEGLQLKWSFADAERLNIYFDNETQKHVFVQCDATTLHKFTSFVESIARDVLDTCLPNRLFVPGLAEARNQIHERTDLPLSASKQKQTVEDSDYIQPPAFFVLSFCSESQDCGVDIKLLDQTSASYCTITLQLAAFDYLMFMLPCKLEEFCEYSLTSSCAMDFTSIEMQDSVIGSHWRKGFAVTVPTHFRYLQKLCYLPALRCERKVRIYTKCEKVSIFLHLHETTLRFLVDFVRNLTASDDATTTTSTVKMEKDKDVLTSESKYYLRISRMDFSVSYKPETTRGTVANTTFLEFKNIPNIALSNAHFSLQAYDELEPTATFSASLKSYITQCLPQIRSLLLSASKALPVVQPLVQTGQDFVADLSDKNRSWKQTASRVASNVLYGATKVSVATYKLARSTDRWLAKKQSKQIKNTASTTQCYSCPLVRPLHTDEDDDNVEGQPKQLCDYFIHDDYANQRETDYVNRKPSDADSDNEKNTEDSEEISNDVFGNDLNECFNSEIVEQHKTEPKDAISIYANQPHSVTSGLREGGNIFKDNIKVAFDAIVVEPQKAYKNHGNSWRHGTVAALYGLPRALIRSASGISGAAVKVGHGISNAVDKEKCMERSAKWKKESYIN